MLFPAREGRPAAASHLLGTPKLDWYQGIGKRFSRMAKFAQNRILVQSDGRIYAGGDRLPPKKAKGAPIRGALQKTGADLSVKWSAEEFLVTKAHVSAPSVVVEARNVVRCIVETSQLLVTL
jgi:hypothetical protein